MTSNWSSPGRRYRVASLLATSVAIGSVLGTVVDAQARAPGPASRQRVRGYMHVYVQLHRRPQTFTVPDGVTSVIALVYGAFGGPVCVAKSTALPFTPGGAAVPLRALSG